MGCPSGKCPVVSEPSQEGDGGGDAIVQLMNDLALAGRDSLKDDDACCAFCAGIDLDPCCPPRPAREMIRDGRAPPIAVIAYKAAYAAKQGKHVEMESNGGCPILKIDGNVVDPLQQYRDGFCPGGGTC